jgi:hypothetical protein
MTDDLCLKLENITLGSKKYAMTQKDIEIVENGDIGQGENLNSRKYR